MDGKKIVFWSYAFPLFALGPFYLRWLQKNFGSPTKLIGGFINFEQFAELDSAPKVLFQISQAFLFSTIFSLLIILSFFLSVLNAFSQVQSNAFGAFYLVFVSLSVVFWGILAELFIGTMIGLAASSNLDFRVPLIWRVASKVNSAQDFRKRVILTQAVLTVLAVFMVFFVFFFCIAPSMKNISVENIQSQSGLTPGLDENARIREGKINGCFSGARDFDCFANLAIEYSDSNLCKKTGTSINYLSDPSLGDDLCYHSLAQKTKDQAVCSLIKSDSLKADCLKTILQ
jgi:hypothetical protein